MKERDILRALCPVTQHMFAIGILLAVGACGDDSDKNKESAVERKDAGGSEDAASPRDSGKDDTPPARDAGGMTSTGGGGDCGGKTCKDPAKCSRDGEPHCACPDGYKDVKGDGSQCDDIDECGADEPACDKQAECKNTPGSFECKCREPAYKGDGKSCDCADGYTLKEGVCLAEDGRKCGDDLDCSNGNCESGICCAQNCENPGNCQASEGASCEDGKTCKYKTADDGAACDDGKACSAGSTCKAGECQQGSGATDCDDKNPCTDDSCDEPSGCKNTNNANGCDDGDPCTLEDKCQIGKCQGSSQKDCSSAEDVCNLGTCDKSNGACKPMPRPASTICNDGNTCTLVDVCTNGSCTGAGNACRENATGCTPGTPNVCTCKDGFVAESGVCVPTDNECASANACSPDADCFDPSAAGGDVTCTCKPGYSGNGTTCVKTDPCAGNPCGEGRGSCVAGDAGKHTCTCSAGYKSVADTCVCDMGGTWGVRIELALSWQDIDGIENGSDTSYTYGLETHTYDDTGKLTIVTHACGATSFDLCGTGMPPFLGSEAYSDYVPEGIWDLPSMPKFTLSTELPNALPGQPFVTPTFASTQGLTLTDPLGAWPSRRQDVEGSSAFDGSAVNGAAWIDSDADNQPALSDFAVPPGGIRADGTAPDPMTDFGANSEVCPRSRPGSAKLPYAYIPALPESGLTPVRVTTVFTASRSIAAYSGSITSCDAYAGDLIGPDNGKPKVDGRVVGCMRQNGNSEVNCSGRTIDNLDTTPQTQKIDKSIFKAKRITQTDNVDCKTVRALNWD